MMMKKLLTKGDAYKSPRKILFAMRSGVYDDQVLIFGQANSEIAQLLYTLVPSETRVCDVMGGLGHLDRFDLDTIEEEFEKDFAQIYQQVMDDTWVDPLVELDFIDVNEEDPDHGFILQASTPYLIKRGRRFNTVARLEKLKYENAKWHGVMEHNFNLFMGIPDVPPLEFETLKGAMDWAFSNAASGYKSKEREVTLAQKQGDA